MKKLLFFLILLVVLGWQCYQKIQNAQKESGRRARDTTVAVEVANVEKRVMRDFGYFSGTLQPNAKFMVAPKIPGRLKKLSVNIGDEITNGQEMALLDDEEYREEVDEAQAEVNVAKANIEESKSNLEIAESELRRLESLGSITSKSQFDIARSQYKIANAKYKVAQSQLVQKEAALNAAKIRLGYTKIKVFWPEKKQKRVIGERFVDEGAMLSANSPIVSVLDISSLIAAVYVIEKDYNKIKIGQEAMLTTDAFPGQSFTGTIIRIAPFLRENSRQARVEIHIPNPDGRLKPGMFANVQVLFEERLNVPAIPITALIKRNQQDGVFLVNPDLLKAQFIPITAGLVEGSWIEVSKPLLEGLVVTLGQHLLSDSTSVFIAKAANTQGHPKREKPQK